MMAKHDPRLERAIRASRIPFAAPAQALTEAVEAAVAQKMASTIPAEQRARGMRAGALPEQGGRAATLNQQSQREQEQLAARIIEAVKGGDTVKTKPVAMALGVSSTRICDAMVRLCALGMAKRVEHRGKDGAVFELIGSPSVLNVGLA